MSAARAAWATVAIGASTAGAIWLYLYRETTTVEYVGYTFGVLHEFHEPVVMRAQPWWAVPAAVALTVAGAVLTSWLLPNRLRPLRRLMERLGGG